MRWCDNIDVVFGYYAKPSERQLQDVFQTSRRNMHLQQTKRESRGSGGPQYYFHDLTPEVKEHLRKQGVVQVALVTPYGATKTHYIVLAAA